MRFSCYKAAMAALAAKLLKAVKSNSLGVALKQEHTPLSDDLPALSGIASSGIAPKKENPVTKEESKRKPW